MLSLRDTRALLYFGLAYAQRDVPRNVYMRIRRAVVAAIAFAGRDMPYHVNYRCDLQLLILQTTKPDAKSAI